MGSQQLHGPWKKVLGFKFTCTENTVIMSAEHTIETMYNTFLINHPKYDARLPGRDVKLTAGDAPAGNDPRLFAYLEMQTETRSLLGLLLWVSLAYPQISHCVNKACGFMSNPSHEVVQFLFLRSAPLRTLWRAQVLPLVLWRVSRVCMQWINRDFDAIDHCHDHVTLNIVTGTNVNFVRYN